MKTEIRSKSWVTLSSALDFFFFVYHVIDFIVLLCLTFSFFTAVSKEGQKEMPPCKFNSIH